MSAVTGSLGRARNSSHVHVWSTPPFSIENVHWSRGVCGVAPAESTGKSRVTDWPGGTRAGSTSASRRRPRKPRETKLISALALVALPQRLERRAQLRREERRLFPCCEVAAPVDLVEVGEAGVNRLDPAAGGGPDLAGERREADGNRDRRRSLAACKRCGQRSSVLPVRPGRRRGGAGQPVQRDVVDDGIPGEVAHGLAIDERAGDFVVAVRIVDEQP